MQFTALHKIILGLYDGNFEEQLAIDDTTLDVYDRFQRTPLCWAAIRGKLNCVKALLFHGADLAIADKLGFTPLHWAAKLGQVECVKALIEAGSSVHAVTSDESRPLHMPAIS
jgi:ankyrin repeat protein